MDTSALHFGTAARLIAVEAARVGLRAPAFRSPPRSPRLVRSIRRWPDGRSEVAVRRRGRPLDRVVADMVDGLLAANGVPAAQAATLRTQLWSAVTAAVAAEVPERAA